MLSVRRQGGAQADVKWKEVREVSKKLDSARLQIVLAIIGLLGVVGAAVIGNYDKIFPPPPPPPIIPLNPPTPPIPPIPKEMQVGVNAPNTNTVGGSIPIRVEVLSAPGNPISGAQVRIEVGGGSFGNSGHRITEGYTNVHGFFADRWTSPAGSAGIRYLVTVSVSKSGFETVSRRIDILVR